MTARQLGETIRKARLEAGLSQKDLAKQINISRATMIAIEKGRAEPSFTQGKRLFLLLNIKAA